MNRNLQKILNEILRNNELTVEIKQTVEIKDLLVVRVDCAGTIKYGDERLDRNVYAFNQMGEQVWQIQPVAFKQSPKPYVNLCVIDNKLLVENWIGIKLSVDLEDGFVKQIEMGNRPW